MLKLNHLKNPANQPEWLKIGYGVVGLALLCQISLTAYQTSLSLRDNQKLVLLQQQKLTLLAQQSQLDRTIAKETAIKPIQQAAATEFVPITKFLTASQHLTVASR